MGALISDCKQYRYWLTRRIETMFPEKEPVLFVMLNPSTADDRSDDPTIRRCIGFAETWGCDRLTVANLYAYRATNPRILRSASDPIGPLNDSWLKSLASDHKDVVCAWGATAQEDRVRNFCLMMREIGVKLWCLGTTKSGAPRHPLYLKSNLSMVPWNSEQLVNS